MNIQNRKDFKMDYNKKFEEMLKDAEHNGYIFKDGKFIQNTDVFIPVMEVFLQTKSTYEESGYYYIYKHTFTISEDDYDKLMNYAELMHDKTLDFNNELDDNIYDIIMKYISFDKKCDLFEDSYYDGNVFVRNETYEKYDKESQCLDLYFDYKQNNTESRFPVGYISVYKMMNTDYAKVEDVNMWLKKFMRYN